MRPVCLFDLSQPIINQWASSLSIYTRAEKSVSAHTKPPCDILFWHARQLSSALAMHRIIISFRACSASGKLFVSLLRHRRNYILWTLYVMRVYMQRDSWWRVLCCLNPPWSALQCSASWASSMMDAHIYPPPTTSDRRRPSWEGTLKVLELPCACTHCAFFRVPKVQCASMRWGKWHSHQLNFEFCTSLAIYY